jgi:hypothetical protein
MTIVLSESILPVRGEVSDIPEVYITDIQIYRMLKSAKIFIDKVMAPDLPEETLKSIYEAMGAYYTYVNWTGIAEKTMGTAPSMSFFRVSVLREKVLQLMGEDLIIPLNDNLTINYKRFQNVGAIAYSLTTSAVDDDP